MIFQKLVKSEDSVHETYINITGKVIIFDFQSLLNKLNFVLLQKTLHTKNLLGSEANIHLKY